ncbi:Uncharacterized conserved protein, DUF58 family, contains vWF domain [Halogranum gelatinilyticum]|uniref:Uncharacterized conserved protein, DUF58 family, contains vWF domain n=1 Tax=Halogranum gelatinilyticum TaxID=660521 RepID=A0A1G9XWI0_9EURY|nr:DUF58 domain-containing protein [Halogranum gelatinilyticum]SDN01222.1 Uncharacterized conserved protein, DUF58 family, contains vWF domain [Halogranum gelatinilyticum]
MRLTRRGGALVVVCVAGFAVAGVFGARSLNAVVLPGIVGLVAGALQLRRLDAPSVSRELPNDDFVGETHEVTLRFRDVDRPFVGTVTDTVGAGLSASGGPTTVAVGDEPVSYDVTYDERGEQRFGPARVVARDVLGLFETDLVCPGTDSLLVYPRVHPLSGWTRRELFSLSQTDRTDERSEFDSLREYVRGDALRDIHWKSSAKRDDLIVQQFAADYDVTSVTVSGGADPDAADELAEAAASIATVLHDAEIPVTLSLPNGRVDADVDLSGRTQLLEHCALVVDGAVPDPDADIVVEARSGGVEVRIGEGSQSFASLAGGRRIVDDAATREAAA